MSKKSVNMSKNEQKIEKFKCKKIKMSVKNLKWVKKGKNECKHE